MGEPFLGELRIISFNYPPKGWAFANGQILSIAQNTALFSLLGTYYGGNGVNTFALPNLQGRAALHADASYPIGSSGGEANHSLSVSELPAHSHAVAAGRAQAKHRSPAGATWAATTGLDIYGHSANVPMAPGAVTQSIGFSVPHANEPPYLVLNVVIALVGIFPSMN